MNVNPNAAPDETEPCFEAGHVHGCPGRAGGDHELDTEEEPA